MTFKGAVSKEELENMKTPIANQLANPRLSVHTTNITTAFKTGTVVIVTIKTTPEKANLIINGINGYHDFVMNFNNEELAPMQPLISVSTAVRGEYSK